MIVNGKAIATDILKKVRSDIASLPRPLVRAIVCAPSAATESYVRIKERRAREAGMDFELVRVENDATTADLLRKLELLGADAVIVQLPLPPTIDTKTVLDAIPQALDADVLSTAAHEAFEKGAANALLPPVVAAVKEVLERSNVHIAGKRAVVIGRGWLVGEPVAQWLTNSGAEVTVLTREEGDFSVLKEAEIVVSGAGSPGIIQPEHLREGVVLIDAGTSESGGAIVGDAAPECGKVASVFTPVPGGIGPIAVACLFRNAATLALRNAGKAL